MSGPKKWTDRTRTATSSTHTSWWRCNFAGSILDPASYSKKNGTFFEQMPVLPQIIELFTYRWLIQPSFSWLFSLSIQQEESSGSFLSPLVSAGSTVSSCQCLQLQQTWVSCLGEAQTWGIKESSLKYCSSELSSLGFFFQFCHWRTDKFEAWISTLTHRWM